MRHLWLLAVLMVTLPTAVLAKDKVLVGYVEKVVIEPYGFVVKARVDTGANTSSIQADNVERFDKDGEEWVRFDMELELADQDEDDDHPEVTVERKVERNIRIKKHGGGFDRRAVVKMAMCFAGEVYDTEFSLKDRDALFYPVLLGRRFLRKKVVVDPEKTYNTQPDCSPEDDRSK